jgi:hypothetical protein
MLELTVATIHDSSKPPEVLTSWPQHHALGRWLARHARLCSSVDITLTQQTLPTINSQPPSLQQAAAAFEVLNAVVAAGWQAAARGPSSARLNRTTRQQAAAAALLYPPTSAATTAAVTSAAAAILGSSSSSRSGQALPLTVFASSMPSAENVMLALAGFTQLTRLELCLSDREATRVRGRAALASLTSLKELVLGQHSAESGMFLADSEMNRSLEALHSALPLLTCLTYCSFGGVPTQRFLDVLPVGLAELTFGSQVLLHAYGAALVRDLAHLTNVTKLRLPSLLAESVLPPLLCLLACEFCSAQPLLLLRHLKRLSLCGRCATAWRQLSMVASALTHVSHLSVTCHPLYVANIIVMSDLPPLRDLTLQTFAGYRVQRINRRDCHPFFGSHLARRNRQSGFGLGEHLTCLVLQDLQLLPFGHSLGPQLNELPALQELRLVRVYAQPRPASCSDVCATVWKELVCGVSELKSLRWLPAPIMVISCSSFISEANRRAYSGVSRN